MIGGTKLAISNIPQTLITTRRMIGLQGPNKIEKVSPGLLKIIRRPNLLMESRIPQTIVSSKYTMSFVRRSVIHSAGKNLTAVRI